MKNIRKNILKIFLNHVQITLRSCPNHAQIMSKSCPDHARIMPEACPDYAQIMVLFGTCLKSVELGSATVRISMKFCVFWLRFHPERRSAALLYVGSKVDFGGRCFHNFWYLSEVLRARECYNENLHEILRFLIVLPSRTEVVIRTSCRVKVRCSFHILAGWIDDLDAWKHDKDG